MTATHYTRALSVSLSSAARSSSAALALWLAATAITSGLVVNVSPSLPLGVYRRVAGPPVRGTLVLVCLSDTIGRLALARGYLGPGACPGGAGRLGKTVAAIPGDTVDVEASGVTINGHSITGSAPRAHDRAGRPLPSVAPGPWVVPPGTLFLLATHHPLSFDSRYYGVVSAAAVVGCITPLYVLPSA
jgi:conjugative transfer signal peptidase TraF